MLKTRNNQALSRALARAAAEREPAGLTVYVVTTIGGPRPGPGMARPAATFEVHATSKSGASALAIEAHRQRFELGRNESVLVGRCDPVGPVV